MNPIRSRSDAGFSLLELVVVIAIISILFGILVPPMFHLIQYIRHLGD